MSAQEVLSTAPATQEASDKCWWVLLFIVVIVTSESAFDPAENFLWLEEESECSPWLHD